MKNLFLLCLVLGLVACAPSPIVIVQTQVVTATPAPTLTTTATYTPTAAPIVAASPTATVTLFPSPTRLPTITPSPTLIRYLATIVKNGFTEGQIEGDYFGVTKLEYALNEPIYFSFKLHSLSENTINYGAIGAVAYGAKAQTSWVDGRLTPKAVLEWTDNIKLDRAGVYQLRLGVCANGLWAKECEFIYDERGWQWLSAVVYITVK